MAARRLSRMKVREILRLKLGKGLSQRQVARCCDVSRSTVKAYEERALEAGLTWPIPDEVDLEKLLHPARPRAEKVAEPDWEWVYREKKRKGVTLKLLWQEHQANQDGALSYTQFTVNYKKWLGTQNLSMRQVHHAGEKMFVDYAGQTVRVDDPDQGSYQAQIFVASLGASHYTYVEASKSQSKQDWLMAHVRAFEFFDGVPEMVIPDNLKSAVNKACRYEPELNRAYQELAHHYDTVICPARVRKPKDKAVVEGAVQVVERWILAKIRDVTFRSLAELNQTLASLLETYNQTAFQKRSGSRRSDYEQIDRPALRPLPSSRYVYAEWKTAKAHVDYHVEVDKRYYSIPHAYHGRRIDLRITTHTIEGFYNGTRIMAHQRLYGKQRFATQQNHMPSHHQRVAEWHPDRFLKWAAEIGVHTQALVERILMRRNPVQQSYRSCLGVLQLAKRYDKDRLEKACHRALVFQGTSYKSVKSILEKGLDRVAWEVQPELEIMEAVHDNVRGSDYYKEVV